MEANEVVSGQAVLDFDADQALEVPEGFEVRDEDSANWVVRKICEARAYMEKVREFADRELARASKDEEFFLSRFGPGLEKYASASLKGKKRSVALPAGTLGFRKQPARLVVENDEQALKWAKAYLPAAVVVVPATEKLSKSALNEAVSAAMKQPDGAQIPDGARWQDERDSFFVK